jgi:hypothetical protein
MNPHRMWLKRGSSYVLIDERGSERDRVTPSSGRLLRAEAPRGLLVEAHDGTTHLVSGSEGRVIEEWGLVGIMGATEDRVVTWLHEPGRP